MKVTANEISSAAAVVALLSALFTGVSLRWAKRSADAAGRAADAAEVSAGTDKESLALQKGQELAGSAPRLSGAVKRGPGGDRKLVITLKSDVALTAMDVSVTEGQGITFIPLAPGVYPSQDAGRSFRAFAFNLAATDQPAGLEPKQSMEWGVRLDNPAKVPATLRVEADCRAGDVHWPPVPIDAPVDPNPRL
jgi:hypothetical protein